MVYEGQFSIKYKTKFLALSYQQYSSNEVHMKALGILLKWGYGSLDSTKK